MQNWWQCWSTHPSCALMWPQGSCTSPPGDVFRWHIDNQTWSHLSYRWTPGQWTDSSSQGWPGLSCCRILTRWAPPHHILAGLCMSGDTSTQAMRTRSEQSRYPGSGTGWPCRWRRWQLCMSSSPPTWSWWSAVQQRGRNPRVPASREGSQDSRSSHNECLLSSQAVQAWQRNSQIVGGRNLPLPHQSRPAPLLTPCIVLCSEYVSTWCS